MVKLNCYHCGSDQLARNGLTQNGKQRYLCSECGRTSRADPQPNGYTPAERERSLRAYHERSSLRGLSRTFGVSRQPVTSWLKKRDDPTNLFFRKGRQTMLQATSTRTTTVATELAILYARESDPYGDRKERKHREAGTTIEASLKQQIAEEIELAKSLGAAVSEEDIHRERFSGVDSLQDRPEINSIREKIKTGKYRYFICYDTDRLARDTYDTGLIMRDCMKHGCELKFVKMPLENSEAGMVLLFVRGLGDKMEAAKFRDRSKRGRKAVISAGRIPTTGKPSTVIASIKNSTSGLSMSRRLRLWG